MKYLYEESPPLTYKNFNCENIFLSDETNEIMLIGLNSSMKQSQTDSQLIVPQLPDILNKKESTDAIFDFGLVAFEMLTGINIEN